MKLNKSHIWYIRSRDRFNGEIYNFNINTPSFLLNHSPEEIVKITLVDLVLKRNKYPIDTNNNRFIVSETQNSVTVIYSIAITPGNYNVYQLATQVANQLTNTSTFYSYSLTWNSISGYYTITATTKTANPFQAISWDFNVERSAHELLGFAKTTVAFTSGSLISTKMASLTGETAIFIRTNLGGVNYDYSNGEYGYSDILAKIPIIVPPYATIVFQDNGSSVFNTYVKTNSLATVNIRLTNAEDILLEFQDEYTLCFKLEFFQPTKEEDILEQLKQINNTQKLNLISKYNNQK